MKSLTHSFRQTQKIDVEEGKKDDDDDVDNNGGNNIKLSREMYKSAIPSGYLAMDRVLGYFLL